MITPKGLHYRRYRVQLGLEGEELKSFSLKDLSEYKQHEMVVTFMCTGNRRSEFNTEADGETMCLPWKNGSISTARWTGISLADVFRSMGIEESIQDKGYHFLTMLGL